MTTISLEARRAVAGQRGGDLRLDLPSRWVRVAAYFDAGPRMSHIGLWRTHLVDLVGLNFRFKWWGGYVTCLAHTRKEEAPR